jgi:hypothetical protein
VTGTIGQADTGVNSAGSYINSAGFWPGNFGCVVNLTDLTRVAEAWLSIGTNPAVLAHRSNRRQIREYFRLGFVKGAAN